MDGQQGTQSMMRKRMQARRGHTFRNGGQAGYTLIEMLVAISVSTLLILAIGNYSANSIIGSNQDYNKTLVLANAKEAVGIVARQIRLAKSVVASNDLPDDNAPGAPSALNSWSGAASTSGSTLILQVPSRDSSGNIMWYNGAHTNIYTDDVIFYLDTTTKRLYRRTIANPVAGNAAVTTCPPSKATSTCPSDADVVDDVANLGTSYLKSDDTAPNTPDGTEAVIFTVTETRTINGKVYTGTYKTEATLRNKF
jgi:prepilin-type N-terminal cleavage/methylation domain-containing protein